MNRIIAEKNHIVNDTSKKTKFCVLFLYNISQYFTVDNFSSIIYN